MSNQPLNLLRRLRQGHRAQQYPGDLGLLIEQAAPGSAWKIGGVAALLALSAVLGWSLAPAEDSTLVKRELSPVQPRPEARVEGLELPLDPPAHSPGGPAGERRPVLPGFLATQPQDNPRLNGLRLSSFPTIRQPAITPAPASHEESTQ